MIETNLEIRVVFGNSRNLTGAIEVADGSGLVIWGPVPVCGRADQSSASANNNPDRNPVRLYGDTPTGTFAVTALVRAEDLEFYDAHAYGPHGIIVLEPLSGEAADSMANGRTHFLIHAGDVSSTAVLSATNGSLRLRNADYQQLMEFVETGCVVRVSQDTARPFPQVAVDVESPFDYSDPCELAFREVQDVAIPRADHVRTASAGHPVVFASSAPPRHGSMTVYGAAASRQSFGFGDTVRQPSRTSYSTSYGARLSSSGSVISAQNREASSAWFTSTRTGITSQWSQTVYGARSFQLG